MISDPNEINSVSARARASRMRYFSALLERDGGRNLCLLDVGGTMAFWEIHAPLLPKGAVREIDIVNIAPLASARRQLGDIELFVYSADASDAAALRKPTYDVVHSNSVIEHVGNLKNQKQFADMIRERGTKYFVQTPARTFPIEPHFGFPYFASLPLDFRTRLHQIFSLGFMGRQPDWLAARINCEQTRLIKKKELQHLFPDGAVIPERMFMVTKSYMVTNMERK